MSAYLSPRAGLLAVICLLSAISVAFVGTTSDRDKSGSESDFSIVLQADNCEISLSGEAHYHRTPSSISIYMPDGERGRCAIHLLNFSKHPTEGTYDVETPGDVRTAALCVLEERETRERIASESGSFTITHVSEKLIEGYVEMVLIGGVTGKRYELSGEVQARDLDSTADL